MKEKIQRTWVWFKYLCATKQTDFYCGIWWTILFLLPLHIIHIITTPILIIIPFLVVLINISFQLQLPKLSIPNFQQNIDKESVFATLLGSLFVLFLTI